MNLSRFVFVLLGQLLLLLSRTIPTITAFETSTDLGSTASCTPLSEGYCSSLQGRASDYAAPHNLPSDVQLDDQLLQYADLFLRYTLQNTQSPPACYEFMMHLLCLIWEPPCDPITSLPLLLCPETCRAFDVLISSGVCDDFVRKVLTEPDKRFSAVIAHYENFNCSVPATYFQNETDDDDIYNSSVSSCTNLFSPETQETLINDSPLSCLPLEGSICPALFPGDTFDRTIFIPGWNNREEEVFSMLAQLSPTVDDTCSQWLNLAACLYIHPPCIESGRFLVPCDSTCEKLIETAQSDCNIGEDFMAKFNVTSEAAHFVTLITDFNCSDPVAAVGGTIENTSCLDLYDAGSSEEDLSQGVYIGAIAGSLGGGLVLIVLAVVVTFLCTRTRFRHKMVLVTEDVLGTLKRTPLGKGRVKNEITRWDNDGERGNEVIRLPPREQRKLEERLDNCVIQYSSLTVEMDNCLGQGSFGKVYPGTMELSGVRTVVAIKTIKMITSEEQLLQFLSESVIMKDFKHPNVLSLLGVCFNTPDNSPYIILPYMANGDLKSYLKSKRVHPVNFEDCPEELKLEDLVEMCIEIAEGMRYLTDNKFVHRDLAARNCMVSEEGVVLVGDFGLAKDIYTAEYYRSTGDTRVPAKWMPPEAINDRISNEKTDIWSYGVTCWEVFSLGRSPYPGIENHEILHHISTGGRLDQPALCPDIVYEIMKKCWAPLPENRPSFNELCVLLKDYWDENHFYIVQCFRGDGHL